MRAARLGFILGLCVLCCGCATVNVANLGEEGYSPEEDEERMKLRSDEMAEMLDSGDALYDDQVLEDYLNGIAARLLPQPLRDEGFSVKVKVIKEPSINAFAMPNGRIYVHTGVLAIVDNEAQIAALLGHEMTHILNRHLVKQFRSLKNKTAFIATLSQAGSYGLLFQLGAVSSIYGFSRKHEHEADEKGFELMKDAGYDMRECPKLYEHMEEFVKNEKLKQPFFFSTHPHVKNRVANTREILDRLPEDERAGGGILNTEQYQQTARQAVIDNMEFSLQKGYFLTVEKLVERYISRYPGDPVGYFVKAELFRQRQDKEKNEKVREKTGDYQTAVSAYEQAIALNASLPEAYKGLARIWHATGESQKAVENYELYLQYAANPDDRAYIEQYIKTLKGKQEE